ncbi:phosphotransferase [Actinocatenispora sera]|uniref:phosphotransferase n=1 Tax=Actinocatenispora sera TaxID=390989 RepID=UPI0033DD6FB4
MKRLAVDGWRDLLTRAMELKRRAASAGLPVAVPVEPAEAAFGLGADLGDGDGVIRVHEWLDAVPDGTATPQWWGGMRAALHTLAPAAEAVDAARHLWYGVNPPEAWERWRAAGTARRLAWAAPLRRHRRLVDELSRRIDAAYRSVGDHVRTHRDLVPHNVLVTRDRGAVLIDRETAPDSATLETAAACWDAARHTAGATTPTPPDRRRAGRLPGPRRAAAPQRVPARPPARGAPGPLRREARGQPRRAAARLAGSCRRRAPGGGPTRRATRLRRDVAAMAHPDDPPGWPERFRSMGALLVHRQARSRRPRAQDEPEQRRFLRAVEKPDSVRACSVGNVLHRRRRDRRCGPGRSCEG